MKIIQIHDSKEKSEVCEKILRSLPQWFGIESAILDYIKDVQTMETWVALDTEVVGFVSVNKHNQHTAEIHVLGLLPEHHRKKIGSALVSAVEASLSEQKFKFLTVKTLSENRLDENYDKTRKFYLNHGFSPIEEFKTLWGEHSPCLMMVKSLPPQYYAVIFTSKRSHTNQKEYDKISTRMVELAHAQNGFIKAESVRDSEGMGITVSYWRTLQDIKNWKFNSEHLLAQEFGRSKAYDSFTTQVCQVDREYSYNQSEILNSKLPVFKTQRLVLKAVTSEDIPSYEKYFIDYEVISHLSDAVPWPYPKNGVEEFLNKFIFPDQGKMQWLWGIFEKENPETLIGVVHLWQNGLPENRGFWLGKPFWGKGYMTEAVAPVMDYAFNELGFEKLVFANAVGNEKSRRIKIKTGARLIEVTSAKFVNPEYTEQEVWEITKSEWISAK